MRGWSTIREVTLKGKELLLFLTQIRAKQIAKDLNKIVSSATQTEEIAFVSYLDYTNEVSYARPTARGMASTAEGMA